MIVRIWGADMRTAIAAFKATGTLPAVKQRAGMRRRLETHADAVRLELDETRRFSRALADDVTEAPAPKRRAVK